ncbi:CsbD family protein [Brevundimonas sp.]|uniref:CsbD family protein n=1 Tax=Brevundimonas sp. TaxID=1871086 RepID=UPI001DA11433|nr:CsbD family protein [Brevundimonas sp.]MBL0947450.1 CsbD family protein [Brevundimonas sp.]
MTDQRIEGAAEQAIGKTRTGLGRLTGDRKLELDGRLTEYKGKARDAYGRVIDGLDGLVARAPADYQDTARKGLDFARRKPLLTTGIVAGLAVVLGALGRRR